MFKKLISLVCCFAIVLSLAGCTATDFGSLPYEKVSASEKPKDNLIAENANYTLELNKLNMGLVLTSKATGEQWSTTPIDPTAPEVDEFGMPIKKHPRVESILAVECRNFVEDEGNTYYSYVDAVQDGEVTYEKVDNGIIISYHFTEAEVTIPLECVLTENGVKLSVDPTKIKENDNRVIGLSIAPFFCGVKNDTEDSYLFVPSGSGALVGVNGISEQGNTYSAQVYGNDPAIDEVALVSTKETVKLGVFGAKMGSQAMCAIIDGSPASAKIQVSAGSTTFGFSSCYASFVMRGYTNHVAKLFYEEKERMVYSKKMINQPVSVSFYPLSGEEANYSGMAKCYRNYLTENCGLTDSKNDAMLNLRLIGGTEMKKSFLGIPYETVYPTTTVSQAKTIIEEVKAQLGTNFTVQLKGYGESGLDVGKVAGNYTVNGNLGTVKEVKELIEFATNNNIGTYFDFDIERFDTNSSGFTNFSDGVTNAGELKATQYYYDMAVRDKNKDSAYYLLSPAVFSEVFGKVLNKTEKFGFYGISLDTLSSVAYSDYANKEDAKYYSKNGFTQAATDVIKSAKDSGKKFMASGANDYAAALADLVTEAPVTSDKSNLFLYDIPFYQMVFKGSVPITTQSINLAADSRFMLLKAVESGSGLGYTVTNGWDSTMIDAKYPYFFNSVYSDIKDGMFETVKNLSSYYESINGQKIASHRVLDGGLRETVFENGVTVYVNYTDNALTSPAGEVAPHDYLITEI